MDIMYRNQLMPAPTTDAVQLTWMPKSMLQAFELT